MGQLQNTDPKAAKDFLLSFDKAKVNKITLDANTSKQVLAVNSNRAYALIVVTASEPVTLLLGEGDAAINKGILLTGRGSSFEIGHFNLFTGRVAAIAANLAEISITECSF